jgi:hypothetical protein
LHAHRYFWRLWVTSLNCRSTTVISSASSVCPAIGPEQAAALGARLIAASSRARLDTGQSGLGFGAVAALGPGAGPARSGARARSETARRACSLREQLLPGTPAGARQSIVAAQAGELG